MATRNAWTVEASCGDSHRYVWGRTSSTSLPGIYNSVATGHACMYLEMVTLQQYFFLLMIGTCGGLESLSCHKNIFSIPTWCEVKGCLTPVHMILILLKVFYHCACVMLSCHCTCVRLDCCHTVARNAFLIFLTFYW